VLSDALRRSDPEVVKAALQMLVDQRELDAETHLTECLEHPVWEIRRLAADLVGRLGGPDAATRLRQRLGVETDPLVRDALYRALSKQEGVGVVVRRTTPPPTHQR
jgi:HEAT repeat protein